MGVVDAHPGHRAVENIQPEGPRSLALRSRRPAYVRCGRRSQRAAYVCSRQRSDYGLPLRQSASADPVEAFLAEQILTALSPAAEVEERRR